MNVHSLGKSAHSLQRRRRFVKIQSETERDKALVNCLSLSFAVKQK